MSNNEILDQLYEKLEKIRNDRNLTKTEFAKQAGFSQNWYQQALKQKRDISYTDVTRLASHYGFTLSIGEE